MSFLLSNLFKLNNQDRITVVVETVMQNGGIGIVIGALMFENTKFEQKNQQGQQVAIVELTKPIEVIFEGADLDVYKKISAKEAKTLDLDNVKVYVRILVEIKY